MFCGPSRGRPVSSGSVASWHDASPDRRHSQGSTSSPQTPTRTTAGASRGSSPPTPLASARAARSCPYGGGLDSFVR
jgi:hypothetical protein